MKQNKINDKQVETNKKQAITNESTRVNLVSLFKKVVEIETRLAIKEETDKKTSRLFVRYVYIILLLNLFAIVENALLHILVTVIK